MSRVRSAVAGRRILNDEGKTKRQLIDELAVVRERVAQMESAQAECERATRALRASDERYRSLLAAVPDLIIRISRDGTFLDYSPSTQFTTYVPPDHFLGAKMQSIMPSGMVERTMEAIERVLDLRARETVQYQLSEPHGVRHYEARISPAGRDDVVCIIRDITERKEAEIALLDSEKRYRELFENSRGLICTHDLDGRVLSVNAAAAQSLGYEPRELVGRKLEDLLAPDVRQLLRDYLDRMQRDGFAEGLMRVVSKDGEQRTWAYHNVLQDATGRPPYVIGHALDVTELRRAEMAAHGYEDRYRALFERAPLAVCQIGMDGRLIDANSRLASLLGYDSRQELLALDMSRDIVLDPPAFARFTNGCSRGVKVERLVTRWRRKDGRPLAVQLSGWAVGRTDGEPECIDIVVEEGAAPGE